MANFNKVILVGNLTRDPQLSYLPSQTAVVDFGIATNRQWKGQDGQQREEVCFVDCRVFGKPAETINKYCKKGRPLMVEGRLTFDSWTGKDGVKRSKLRVTVENFQFISAGGSGERVSSGGDENQSPADDYGSAEQHGGSDDIPF
ncbi:MAG: single-stranded DNA-binding protein [Phycisphaerae bacterium]|nr:single-stranded DNA-binding protein [Phycisphaerae bacterium]